MPTPSVVLHDSMDNGRHVKLHRNLLDYANEICQGLDEHTLQLKLLRQLNWKVAGPAAKLVRVEHGNVIVRLKPTRKADECFECAITNAKQPAVLYSAMLGRIDSMAKKKQAPEKTNGNHAPAAQVAKQASPFELLSELGKLQEKLQSVKSVEVELEELANQKKRLQEEKAAIVSEILEVEHKELELMQKLDDDPETAKARELATMLQKLMN